MKTKTTAILAAGQIKSARGRRMEKLKDDPIARNEHFKKYNINAVTYDPKYVREYGEEYLPFLETQVQEAANQNAELLLLPEFCFVPGVVADVHPTIGKNSNARADALKLYTWSANLFTDWMKKQSKKTGMLLACATFTVRDKKIYNTGLLTDERGRLALRYEKIHLPWDEITYVACGREYNYADTRLGRIAFSICYDIQFPEHSACLATHGVKIVLHPSGGYTCPGEPEDGGQVRLRARASDHRTALVYSCFGGDTTGCRDSAVIDPNGIVKACVNGNGFGFAVGEVSIGKVAWPNDKPEAPDREQFKRQFRRPSTYRLLTKPQKKL